MTSILFYLFIWPLSKLPLSVLYYLSDGLYVVLYRWLGYRKEVVMGNITRSFPDKNSEEIEALASDFYRHFCDIIFESVRLFSMSEEELMQRAVINNPEQLEYFYKQNKPLLVIAGHYGSWELIATAYGLFTSAPAMAIYSPLKNKFFDQKMMESRGQFGLILVSKQDSRKWFAQNPNQAIGIIMGGDQSPTSSKKSFWMEFLNQDTAIMFGTEKFAKEYNIPVVYGDIQKVKRGHYATTFHIVTENPSEEPHGEITRKHTRMLEASIRREPRYWLWTHRRWKRKRESTESNEQTSAEESAS